jgi:hypothetical protein
MSCMAEITERYDIWPGIFGTIFEILLMKAISIIHPEGNSGQPGQQAWLFFSEWFIPDYLPYLPDSP